VRVDGRDTCAYQSPLVGFYLTCSTGRQSSKDGVSTALVGVYNHLTEMCSGSEAGSHRGRIDFVSLDSRLESNNEEEESMGLRDDGALGRFVSNARAPCLPLSRALSL
jgi:hypothetical protein